MNTSSAPLFAVFIKQASLTTSILVALGLGFGIPAFADGGAVGLTNSNQALRCSANTHNLNNNGDFKANL
ncbi:MAG: hypothetical protein Q3971_08675 [Moraxella sp.]|nr:hypothetical protein [Moraxella sp.]